MNRGWLAGTMPFCRGSLFWLAVGVVSGGTLTLALGAMRAEGWGQGRIASAPPQTLRLALCQYDTRADRLRWNIEHASRYAQEAFEGGAHMVVFPEFSFQGFSEVGQQAKLMDRFVSLRGMAHFSRLARQYDGYLLLNIPDNVTGGIANTSILLGPDGREVGRYHKRRLAQIDRRAGFVRGEKPGLFDLPFGRLGLLICRDTQVAELANRASNTTVDVGSPNEQQLAQLAIDQYAETDLIIAQMAFAGSWTPRPRSAYVRVPIMETVETKLLLARTWARQTGAYVAIANKTGLECGSAFIGGSLAVNPGGELIAHASSGPGIVYVDLPLDDRGRLTPSSPRALPGQVPTGVMTMPGGGR